MSAGLALVVSVADPTTSPRPRRAVETLLALGYRVETLGQAPSREIGIAAAHVLPAPSRGRVRGLLRRLRTLLGMVAVRVAPSRGLLDSVLQARFGTRRMHASFAGRRFDLIVVEDVQLLPFAFTIRGDARIVFDAREYYPSQDAGSFWFDLLHGHEQSRLCREYMPRCDAVVTVSDGIAAAYRDRFGVGATVVRSVTRRQALPVRPVEGDSIRLVHHGVANRNRDLRRLIDIADGLQGRCSLDLYLTGDASHIAELQAYASRVAGVRFHAPVRYEDICTMLNGYDMGIVFYGDGNFNHVHCLPNKLFEYIQARLAVAVSPSPDMASLVREWNCGVVAPDYDPRSMIPVLGALTPAQVDAMKHASDRAAAELNWDVEGRKLAAVFRGLA